MGDHPNHALIQQAYVAINGGDTDWLVAHIHPDAVFHQGGRFPTAGTYHGRDAIFGHMMEFFAMVDFTMKTDVHDVLADDDHAVGLIRVSLDFQGRHLEFDEAHVFHLTDGIVTEMWAVPVDPYAVDEFFAA